MKSSVMLISWRQFWKETWCQLRGRTCCQREWLGIMRSPGDEGWRFGDPWPFSSPLFPPKPISSLFSLLLLPSKLPCSPSHPSKLQLQHHLNWGQRIGRSKLTKPSAASLSSPKDVSCLLHTFCPLLTLNCPQSCPCSQSSRSRTTLARRRPGRTGPATRATTALPSVGRPQDPAQADSASAVFVSKRGKGLISCDFLVMGINPGVKFGHSNHN